MALDIQIKGANKLREMAVQLRKADKEYLGRELNKAIRNAAQPTLEDLREAARTIRTEGVRRAGSRYPFVKVMPPKGTRDKIAESVNFRVSALADNPRVQFRTGRGLPENLAAMPRKFDSTEFRHPVMGNRDVWVSQRSQPWFFKPIKDRLDTFRDEIDQALDRTREMLERG